MRVPGRLPAAGAFERGSAGASGGLSRGFGLAGGRAPGGGKAARAAEGPRRGGRFGRFVRREPPRSVPCSQGKGLGPAAGERGAGGCRCEAGQDGTGWERALVRPRGVLAR